MKPRIWGFSSFQLPQFPLNSPVGIFKDVVDNTGFSSTHWLWSLMLAQDMSSLYESSFLSSVTGYSITPPVLANSQTEQKNMQNQLELHRPMPKGLWSWWMIRVAAAKERSGKSPWRRLSTVSTSILLLEVMQHPSCCCLQSKHFWMLAL